MKKSGLILALALAAANLLPIASAAPLPVNSAQKDSDGVTFQLQPGILKLRVYSSRTIEVVYSLSNSLPAEKSLSVITQPVHTKWDLTEAKDGFSLVTDDLVVRVNRATGALTFTDKAGKTLLAEKPSGGKSLTPAHIGRLDTLCSEAVFDLPADEAVYGLGQHQEGYMNYHGEHVRLLQQNTKVAVPVLVSSRGYGLFWDNPAVTDVDFGNGAETMIPDTQLFDENGRPGGLTARYYRGENFDTPVRTNLDAQIDFEWSDKPPEGLPHDHYSVCWTGFVEADDSSDYTFVATADDGVRLWIDDQEVINDWRIQAPHASAAKVQFAPHSRHRIRMEYFQSNGGAMAQLAWQVRKSDSVATWTSEAADKIDYYFMYGPELDQVIGDYRELTGAAPMFAKWAWGFWQCKERYQSQAELLDVAAHYRAMHVPMDGIIQDWQYWSPNPWGSHIFDTNRYPDPAALMHDLHTNHVHALISVWAKFDVGSTNSEELIKAGGMYPQVISYVFPPGKGQWYDAFNPVARAIYWQQISRQIFAAGFDGWWLDASEPELSGKLGEFRGYTTAAGPGATVFNAYPLEHTRAVYEGQRKETSDKRVIILTRSAYAGQQRNAAITWSGDIRGDWSVFQNQIPAGLNFSLSGIPYWNTDTGGFFGGDPADPKYRELFTRWFQFSAFCPMFRVHGTGKPKEMWRFDPATQKILIAYDQLRYRLLPYIYSVSWMVTHDNYTMLRPLVMDFRSDTKTFELKDQFMFGPAFMACPVTKAGDNNRQVYLPAGAKWYDFWTGNPFDGGQQMATASPIETMPLFVRAGSIIPCGPDIEYAAQNSDPVELRVYRGADGAFSLYEDEGDNYDYEKGKYATIPFTWNEASQTLTIGARTGTFPGMLKKHTFRIVFVSPGHGTGLPPEAKPDEIVQYTGKPVIVHRK